MLMQCWYGLRNVILTCLFIGITATFCAETAFAAVTMPAVQINKPALHKSTVTTVTSPTSIVSKSTVSTASSVKVVAAQVVWVKGVVKATSSDQKVRALQRKDFVYESDTISSEKGGTGQLVFSDGTMISLSENTVIKISQYRYNKNVPNQEKYVVDVVKGGFRTVTGLISKAGPSHYKIETPVATIGVRGTVIVGFIDSSGKGYFAVPLGATDFTNASGKYPVDNYNQYAEFASFKVPANYTPQPAPVLGSVPAIQAVKPSPELTQKSSQTSAVAATQGSSGGSGTSGGTTTGGSASGGSSSSGGSSGSDSSSDSGSSSSSDSSSGSGDSSTSSTDSTSSSTGTSDTSTQGTSGSSSSTSDTTQGVTNDFTVCP